MFSLLYLLIIKHLIHIHLSIYNQLIKKNNRGFVLILISWSWNAFANWSSAKLIMKHILVFPRSDQLIMKRIRWLVFGQISRSLNAFLLVLGLISWSWNEFGLVLGLINWSWNTFWLVLGLTSCSWSHSDWSSAWSADYETHSYWSFTWSADPRAPSKS